MYMFESMFCVASYLLVVMAMLKLELWNVSHRDFPPSYTLRKCWAYETMDRRTDRVILIYTHKCSGYNTPFGLLYCKYCCIGTINNDLKKRDNIYPLKSLYTCNPLFFISWDIRFTREYGLNSYWPFYTII